MLKTLKQFVAKINQTSEEQKKHAEEQAQVRDEIAALRSQLERSMPVDETEEVVFPAWMNK